MGINKLVFAALTVGCLVAAGLGGFLAVRFGQPAVEAEAGVPTAMPASSPASLPPGSVTESEGIITPAPPPKAPPKAVAPPTARKAEPARASTPREAAAPRPESRRAEAAPARRPEPPSRPATAPAPAPAPTETPAAAPATMADNTGTMWETRAPVAPERPPFVVEEPPQPAPPPEPEFVDLQVPADAVLGLQVERTITSDTARVEDKVSARVTRDVRVGNRIAIPAGSVVSGSVTEVERGGKMKGKARLAVRFHTVTMADGSQLALRTDAVIREGQSPSGETAAKVGGAAVGGAILGAILGGGKGAAIGAGMGAAGGTAAAMTNDRNPATLPAGTSVTVRVQQPVTVTVAKE